MNNEGSSQNWTLQSVGVPRSQQKKVLFKSSNPQQCRYVCYTPSLMNIALHNSKYVYFIKAFAFALCQRFLAQRKWCIWISSLFEIRQKKNWVVTVVFAIVKEQTNKRDEWCHNTGNTSFTSNMRYKNTRLNISKFKKGAADDKPWPDMKTINLRSCRFRYSKYITLDIYTYSQSVMQQIGTHCCDYFISHHEQQQVHRQIMATSVDCSSA